MAQNERMVWLDCLRLMAGVSMLVLHCTADASGGAWSDYSPAERAAPLLLRAVAYSARTELFIIISFFLLMSSLENRPRGYRATMREQARRLLVPFLFWTAFYALFNIIKAHQFGYLNGYLNSLTSLETWFKYLLLGGSKYHMHFLPTLFAVLLAYPIMKKAIDAPALGAIALVICLVARAQFDEFFYARFWNHELMPFIARSIKVATHVGYGVFAAACLGLWHRRGTANFPSWLPIMAYATLLLLSFKLLATWRTIDSGEWDFHYTAGYWADFLMPACLFLLFMLASGQGWPTIISRWAKYAFGIYLTHPIALDCCEILLRSSALPPWSLVSLKICGTLSGTLCLVIAISRFRTTSWTIGLTAPIARKGNTTIGSTATS